MGVFLILLRCHLAGCRLPHARGGVSPALAVVADTGMSSPRTWGCFQQATRNRRKRKVFPTHVGVFPLPFLRASQQVRLPHARGGVSTVTGKLIINASSSPRTWGCFSPASTPSSLTGVFPTHVGVFLRAFCPRSPSPRLPHARGGVSASRPYATAFCQSSPRTWGCFHAGHGHETQAGVFPTHVGVFLKRRIRSAFGLCLPYARGIFQKNY